MDACDLSRSDPKLLARMMDPDCGTSKVWRPEELGAILEHQMTACVQFDLASLDKGLANRLQALSASEGLLVKSFRDIFLHPNPPVELLVLTKEFAKAMRNHPDSALPPEISTLLYFASIVAALVHCHERITELDDDALRRGIDWLVQQPWVDEPSRELFRDGLRTLNAHREPPP